MANPKIFPAKLELYTLSATSTDPAYPLSNLQTYVAADRWHSNSTGASQVLVIDFGSAVSKNFLVIQGHNFPAAYTDRGFTLIGADSADLLTNPVTYATGLEAAADPQFYSFAAGTKRFWGINFGNHGVNVAPQLGNLFLGTSLDFEFPYETPKVGDVQYTTVRVVTLSGLIRKSQPYGGNVILDFQLKMFTDTFKANYRIFRSTVQGSLRPFYFLDGDGTTLYYVYDMTDYNAPEWKNYNQNNFSLKMEGQLANL